MPCNSKLLKKVIWWPVSVNVVLKGPAVRNGDGFLG